MDAPGRRTRQQAARESPSVPDSTFTVTVANDRAAPEPSAGRPLGAAPVIRVRDLRKVYQVPERESGLKAATASLFRRKTRDVVAVGGITFEIAAGEIVGF